MIRHSGPWERAAVEVDPGARWVEGWARRDEYDAGCRYVRVTYPGSGEGCTVHRTRVTFA